jgi:hypothetical protein
MKPALPASSHRQQGEAALKDSRRAGIETHFGCFRPAAFLGTADHGRQHAEIAPIQPDVGCLAAGVAGIWDADCVPLFLMVPLDCGGSTGNYRQLDVSSRIALADPPLLETAGAAVDQRKRRVGFNADPQSGTGLRAQG